MKFSNKSYGTLLFFQILFLICDLVLNSFNCFFSHSSITLLFLFIWQDIGLILLFAFLLISFFSTYVFQVGLVFILYDRFRSTIIVSMLYLILTVAVHVWWLVGHDWEHPMWYRWSVLYTVLYVVQRICAPVFYYLYKRSVLRIADPRFYGDIDWINEELRCRNIH